MGYNLLAENWTVTSTPCSFWLIKETLIYCYTAALSAKLTGPQRQAAVGAAAHSTPGHRRPCSGHVEVPSGNGRPTSLGLEGTGWVVWSPRLQEPLVHL